MPSWSRPVHPPLAPYVVSLVAYDHPDSPPTHHGLPSPTVTVIWSFDDPVDCGWLDDPARDDYWLLVGGLHTRPSLIETHGRQRGVQLSLTPAGAARIFGLPPGALSETIVHGSDLGWGDSAYAALADAPWPERLDRAEALLLSRLARAAGPAISPEVAEAWRVIQTARGEVRVADLAEHVGWSRRHLSARFSTELGVTPKAAAQVARFTHARVLAGGGMPLAEVAYAAGYADQPHLNREWRRLAGLSPLATLADGAYD